MKKTNLLIILALALSLAACETATTEQEYETVAVHQGTLNSTVIATGIIKPRVGAEVRVGSRVSGIVKKLNVKVGDVVKKGDLLASLDDLELTAQYNQIRANLEAAETTLKYSRIEKERQKILAGQSVITEQFYEQTVKAFELAQAQEAQVKANLDYAKIQLDYTKIIAPIGGVVASVTTQEGETVAAAFTSPTFLTIIDLQRLEVRAYVDETDISKVKEGQKTEFTVDTYPGVAFEGIVKAIYPKAELIDNIVNYVVIIDITDNKGKILRPEMTVTASIIKENLENVIAVPSNAINHKNGEESVFILKEGKPVETKVTTGIKNKTLTQILSGLSKNDKVIINKQGTINDTIK